MPTVFAHAALAGTLAMASAPVAGWPPRIAAIGVACAVAPDADVVAFALGVPYAAPWGHRGVSHSLAFAALLALSGLLFVRSAGTSASERTRIGIYLFVAGASHGLLDAMTDGGLGIALFAPFDHTRYFLPWRPIPVSPIGLEGFLSAGGWAVLRAEIVLLGPLCAVLAGTGIWRRSIRPG